MKSKLDQRLKTLEARVAVLERPAPSRTKRGWLKLAGWAKDDPLYDEAMKLGAAWRKTS